MRALFASCCALAGLLVTVESLALGPENAVHWSKVPGTTTWSKARQLCQDKGHDLCPWTTICPGGRKKPVVGGKTDFGPSYPYAAVSDSNNEWVYLGNCDLHHKHWKSQPSWGSSANHVPYRENLACCGQQKEQKAAEGGQAPQLCPPPAPSPPSTKTPPPPLKWKPVVEDIFAANHKTLSTKPTAQRWSECVHTLQFINPDSTIKTNAIQLADKVCFAKKDLSLPANCNEDFKVGGPPQGKCGGKDAKVASNARCDSAGACLRGKDTPADPFGPEQSRVCYGLACVVYAPKETGDPYELVLSTHMRDLCFNGINLKSWEVYIGQVTCGKMTKYSLCIHTHGCFAEYLSLHL